jgi:hypothetical protein
LGPLELAVIVLFALTVSVILGMTTVLLPHKVASNFHGYLPTDSQD